jgi:hypothetical protein
MTDLTTIRTQMLTETTSNEVCNGMTLFADHKDTQWIIQHCDYETCMVKVMDRFTGLECEMQWNSTMFVLPF